ncbi:glycosyltransferase [Acinetobacter variabilis]|uniref:glycosyltransferase n=1 Tax=Acinetobacter variabilis TaxID=70346 RepID=UPI00254A8AE8|nr:glycosyltransferase [Acinetobacter variabilis]
MKILVLTQDYPSTDKPYAMSYVHSRNIEYLKFKHEVKVINFSASKEYSFEGVDVFPLSDDLMDKADLILSHAPNIRNHFKAIGKLKKKKIVFFFHGHEVLRQYGDYPSPYPWNEKTIFKKSLIKFYDFIKLKMVRKYLLRLHAYNELGFIYVSDWMQKQFLKNINLKPELIGKVAVISNANNYVFLEQQYTYLEEQKNADFITIRPLDDSKYAIDLVVNFAINNPDKTFHIYGKGNYFNHNAKPKNIEVINSFIAQKDIPSLLNKYKCALMPTRYDAQGVMVCEMATFGIPVITSDFEVCVEMLNGFNNVRLLNENDFSTRKFEDIAVEKGIAKNLKFSTQKLVEEELAFFDKL